MMNVKERDPTAVIGGLFASTFRGSCRAATCFCMGTGKDVHGFGIA